MHPGRIKGLVLAGGEGTRLRPITYTSAKQLVPVANKPILFYGLEALAAAGVRQVGMVIGSTGDEVRAALGTGEPWGLEITYLPQAAPLGLAHCVLIARAFLGDDDFVMYLGDNLLEGGLEALVDGFTSRPTEVAASILLTKVPDPQRFGVAELNTAGEVVRLVEKPAVPLSDLALMGVYLFDYRIHDAVAAIAPSARGELEITDAIQWLLDRGERVQSVMHDGWWIDTGKLTPLLEANRLILESLERRIDGTVDEESRVEGRVVVEAGAQIVRAVVRGPAIIGAGASVVDSYIGPFTAIGEDCRVVESEVEHSVLLRDSQVIGIRRVVDSLIGKRCVVQQGIVRPQAVRLMLGDDSQVDVP